MSNQQRLLPPSSVALAERHPPLRHALRDLDEILDEAAEEGYDPPPGTVVDYAKRALLRAHELCDQLTLDLYPTEKGSIVVQGSSREDDGKHTVMLECMPDGSAECSYFGPSKRSRQAFYDSADVMLEECGLLPSALNHICPTSERPWTTSHEKVYLLMGSMTMMSSGVGSTARRKLAEPQEGTSHRSLSFLLIGAGVNAPSSQLISFLGETSKMLPDAPKQRRELAFGAGQR